MVPAAVFVQDENFPDLCDNDIAVLIFFLNIFSEVVLKALPLLAKWLMLMSKLEEILQQCYRDISGSCFWRLEIQEQLLYRRGNWVLSIVNKER